MYTLMYNLSPDHPYHLMAKYTIYSWYKGIVETYPLTRILSVYVDRSRQRPCQSSRPISHRPYASTGLYGTCARPSICMCAFYVCRYPHSMCTSVTAYSTRVHNTWNNCRSLICLWINRMCVRPKFWRTQQVQRVHVPWLAFYGRSVFCASTPSNATLLKANARTMMEQETLNARNGETRTGSIWN